ncbi:MAG: hypothetical protein Q8S02_01575 [Hydrogenophaga sp.]|nr:hypothetical protein [Hydrogenophaga sp.]
MLIDDTVLLAYLDGQLDDAQYAPVEDALAESATLRERLQALVDSGERVQRAFDAKLQEAVPTHLVEAIMHAPLNLVPPERVATSAPLSRPRQRVARAWGSLLDHWWAAPAQGGWGRAAFASVAVLAMGVWLGQSLQDGAGPSTTTLAQGQAVPDAALASVLELAPSGRRLATPQGHLEVLATFERQDGALCREFERLQDMRVDAGIACRSGSASGVPWQVAMVASETRLAGDRYQTASDALHQAVNRYVDAQLPGAPLDAAAERALIARAWTR